MIMPQIELIPLRQAVGQNCSTTLDLLVKIIPPTPDTSSLNRPPLNISLVIDRSGSMNGQKIEYARQAACYAIEQLLPTDRVSVVTYDDRVDTLIPSTLATDKTRIINQIQRVQHRGATALHSGWVEGGMQVSQYLNSEYLNRVLLLSDGLANRGETNPDVIATDVKGLSQRGVSTTTMGMGDHYNEDLLEAMANSGDGSYYYIESAEQLTHIFEMELQGLMATVGRDVTLKINPQANIEMVDVFNDFNLTPLGEYKLPNLIMGNPFIVGLRLKIPAIATETDLCNFQLSWDSPQQSQRQTQQVSLRLPAVNSVELEDYPFNDEVREQIALMMSARAKLEATQMVDRGDYRAARQHIRRSASAFSQAVPKSANIELECASFGELESDLKAERYTSFRKRAKHEVYQRLRSSHQSRHDDYYTRRYMKQCGDRISVIQGNIVKQPVDAIVNPTGENFYGGMVDAAIHAAAGSQLRLACRHLAPGKVGEVRITEGFKLPAKSIIHTISPTSDTHTAADLNRCYHQSLKLAQQHSIVTLAFPIMGTGMAGFPQDVAVQSAFEAIAITLASIDSIEKVSLVCLDSDLYKYCMKYRQNLMK
jgi:Ca-activated chloride channel family protein